MIRIAMLFLLAIAFVNAQGSVQAQPPFAGQYNAPTLSPYLNLNNFNGGGILNYFSLVQPQLNTQNQLNQQRSQIQQLQQGQRTNVGNSGRTNPLSNTSIRGTGHNAGYLNYSHYYSFQSRR